MSQEIEVIDVVANQNHQVAHSMSVMEQWGNGETYNEDRWIERGRQAVRQTLEGMFELGRTLIVLKEHTEYRRFSQIVQDEFGIGKSESARLMSATRRFATPQMQKAQAKLMDLGKSKLLELLVEEDDTLVELAEGGDINGHTLDDVDRMTVKELRLALREARDTAEAKDKVIADKSKKIDEYAEKLAKKQSAADEPNPEDVGSELVFRMESIAVGARSDISRFAELFEQLEAHGQAHGFNFQPTMAGCLNQIIMDVQRLRDRFGLPTTVPDEKEPEWLQEE